VGVIIPASTEASNIDLFITTSTIEALISPPYLFEGEQECQHSVIKSIIAFIYENRSGRERL